MTIHKMIALLVGCLAMLTGASIAQTPKEETPYTKLFKGKTTKTKKGMITLHKTEGKLYFEFPVKLLGKNMLLGSVAESVSNPDDAAAGEQAHEPLCIYFTQIDSTIHIKRSVFASVTDKEDGNLQTALDKNNISPILGSFKILAVSPDSQSVVFDPTAFFVSGNAEMDPFMPLGGFYSRRTAFKPENSLLDDIMAYDDNISITSYLSFGITRAFWGIFLIDDDRPATILMKRSLVLLPEQPMRPRLNDPRIGIFATDYMKYAGNDDGVKPVYYANRWKLEPADMEAFKRGERVAPVKPIVFYIDDKFPPHWIDYIRQGVEDWNKAYEQIGFRNAIVTRMYPKNDSTFDPNNIKYNCIKYAPSLTQNAMGPSWVDPRTGEILYASVYVYHGIVDILSDWIFVQTAAADKRVRTRNIPWDLIGKGIRYMMAHEVGHCLGLMHNMGASSAFPVDSLRSPSFTQQYGTTPSIMDYARFNFVAQPGDLEKGVKLTPPDLGVYDYYAIKWLYTPLFQATTPEAEVPVLDQWISEKITNPMYRYGKQQFTGYIDPSAQVEDLGDDQVKATRYMIENLKYIMKHMNDWVKKEDVDFSYRKRMNFSLINIQFFWYWTHALHNIGGIYLYEKYEGDPIPAYKVVPREKQKESVLFLLDVLENLSWLNNPDFEKNIDAMNGDAGEYLRTLLFPYMMQWVAKIGFSETKAAKDPYTQAECIADVFDYIWGGSLAGKKTTKEKLNMQTSLVNLLIRNSRVLEKPGGKEAGLTDLREDELALLQLDMMAARRSVMPGASPLMSQLPLPKGFDKNDISGFGFMPRIAYQNTDVSHIYYQWLLQCRDMLKRLVTTQSGDTKLQYQYLLVQINKSLKAS